MAPFITINSKRVGRGCPVYIVAEMSANHNGSFNRAVEIIKEAKSAGADAIKLQTYKPETMTIDCDNEFFMIKGTPWEGRTLYDLYREAYTPWEWLPELKKFAESLELDFFSTPFDTTAIDFLEKLEVSVYKIASFENVDLPLISNIARTGKPVILSTGMSTLSEIEEAVFTFKKAGGKELALLKCTSAYPSMPEEINLRTIPHLHSTFELPVGISDHTMGIAVPTAAVAMGACIVEKHITLSREEYGPDNAFSLEPNEFADMVTAVRTTEKALGKVKYGAGRHETDSQIFRRSLFAVRDIKKGEKLTTNNICSIRPGFGLHTRHLQEIIGRRAVQNISRGTPIRWNLL